MYEVTMPKMGMAMEDGEIVEWFVEEGMFINEGDMVFTIMTEKATIEIDSPISGLLVEIRAKAGDIVPIGEVIALVNLEAEPPA